MISATRGALSAFQNVLVLPVYLYWKAKITVLDHCQPEHVCLLITLLITEETN